MPPSINWTSIFPYEGDQQRAFEELAFQIVDALHGHEGRLVRVDDRGGGDGVEFYLVLPNGDEWGWQTKFFPTGRLGDGNRYAQIRGSFERALQMHPRLTRWVLCTPMNFTPQEQAWFDDRPTVSGQGWRTLANPLPGSVPSGRSVELDHWGNSTFLGFLSEPRFLGKRYFFFGELHLDFDWFARQYATRSAGLKDKYNPVLHVESHVDHAVSRLLVDSAFLDYIRAKLVWVDALLGEFDRAVQDLRADRPDGIDWEPARAELVAASEQLVPPLRAARAEAETVHERLAAGELRPLAGIDWRATLEAEAAARQEVRAVCERFDPQELPYTGHAATREYAVRRATRIAGEPNDASFRVKVALRELFEEVEGTAASALHVFGPAGAGKTHVACQICADRVGRGLPVLFLPGKLFIDDAPLSAQIRNILGVPPAYDWTDFLGALDVAARAYRTKIPIVIDGLNEAVVDGALAPVWALHLAEFEQEIARYPRLALVTTCRMSYRRAIWQGDEPEHWVTLSGFDYDDVDDAVRRYFEHYRIVGDVTLAPLSEFRLPLYLKLFCEVKNPRADRDVSVYVGQESLFEVFEEYLDATNVAVSGRLRMHPKLGLVQDGLGNLAAALWERRARAVSLEDAFAIVDGCPLREIDLGRSVMQFMLDEGLLVARDWGEAGEVVAFTYDLLGGYLIASHILSRHSDDLEGFFGDPANVALLFGTDWRQRHPLADDIARCVAALLPRRTNGRYLHEFIASEEAFQFSISSLFEVAPQLVNDDAVALISDLFSVPENRGRLLDLALPAATHAGHPLNASFWSGEVATLSITDRDIGWTEHLRKNLKWYESLTAKFEVACRNPDLSDVAEPRVHLLAPLLGGFLTSTIRPFRDRVTCALYWYGRRWAHRMLDLTVASLGTGDPYVSERMLAALYGVVMARQWDFADRSFVAGVLPAVGRALYDAMFRPGAQHATTHILARDYSRHTIDVVLLHHPSLLTDEEQARTKPPFHDGGFREWGEEADRNPGQYRYGNRPIDEQDHNPLDSLQIYGSSQDEHAWRENSRIAEANLWWRIYDLGYTFERFSEIDQDLSRLDTEYGGDRFERRVDGYGGKYCRVATLELAGLRGDRGLMERNRDDPEERLSFVDIDPSFPVPEPDRPMVSADFLGDRATPLQDWILAGEPPDFGPFLVPDEVDEEPGPWVLLDGYASQEDAAAHRNVFVFPRGLIVPAGSIDEMLAQIERQDLGNRWLPEIPSDVYRFAGEIPWCETYPANGATDLAFQVGKEILSTTERRWFRTRDGVEIGGSLERFLARSGADMDAEGAAFADADPDSQAILAEDGIESREVEVNREVPVFETYQVILPVRNDGWESYHSVVVPGRSVDTPAREITDALGLVGQPQTFDLFEQDGRRASITLASGDLWHTGHHLTYLRKDLLDRYLAAFGQELVWGIWGERRVAPVSLSNYLAEAQVETQYVVFQKIERYARPELTAPAA